MTTQITSDLDQIAARLNAFGAELQRPVAGMKAATRAVVGVLKKHFRTQVNFPACQCVFNSMPCQLTTFPI